MQSAKDTFYVALRDRLAALNPARTVFLDGALRPAVIVVENQPVTPTPPLPDAFYVAWGAVRAVEAAARAPRPLLALDAAISWRTRGSEEASGVDRGRRLAELDAELLQIASRPETAKLDYTQSPPVDLGSRVMWLRPTLGEPQQTGSELRRLAKTTLYFFPEVDL
ncbi:MAG: hypothetical protein ACRD2R_01725 [Terriglobales bacterium]